MLGLVSEDSELMFTFREESCCGAAFAIVARYFALPRVASCFLAVLSPFCGLPGLLLPTVRALEGRRLGCKASYVALQHRDVRS